MKKNILIFFLCTVVGSSLIACTEIDDPDNPDNFPNQGKLQVKASLYTGDDGTSSNQEKNIGIFLYKNNADLIYADEKGINIKCTSQEASDFWKLSHEVELGTADATVFAYYPFKDNLNDLKRIPVDIREKEDLCFGFNDQQTKLNRSQPLAFITMRHALAKVRFNLILDSEEEYSGPGIVEDARVVKCRADGVVDEDRYNVLTIEGFMDASTGRIKTSASGKMTIDALIGKAFSTEGIEENEQPFFYSVPETDMQGNAFAIVIDGKQHIIRIDNGTAWRASTINTYTFRLKGEVLDLAQNEDNGFDVKPWEDFQDEIDY